MPITARHYATGAWVQVRMDGPAIAAVEEISAPREASVNDRWVAPAFWDIQTNGRRGVSFADQKLTVEQAAGIVRDQAALGTARLCPTLFTSPAAATEHSLRVLAEVCEQDAEAAAMVLGLHLEGPYICPDEGYRGAHPLAAIRDPDWDEFQRWQELCSGRIVLMTLAPERPGALDFIRAACRSGVVVAVGHTNADAETLRAAADAGATLSTHLGNGIAAMLPRHPNPIFAQAADDRLMASLIADGEHLDADTLRVLVRAKTPERIVLVSDASPLAGCGPGRYGEWEITPEGRIVVAGTPYLAGANRDLVEGISRILQTGDVSLAQAIAMVTSNPARLLGRKPALIAPGEPACLVVLQRRGPVVRLREAWVDGRSVPLDSA